MRKTKSKTLCTAWRHKDGSQTLIIPGKKSETRKEAAQYIGCPPRELTGSEMEVTDKQLKSLSEFEG